MRVKDGSIDWQYSLGGGQGSTESSSWYFPKPVEIHSRVFVLVNRVLSVIGSCIQDRGKVEPSHY